jgi:branched-chain amino acid transport system permease protein
MRAVAYDREAAALMGINTDTVIAFTFLLGSALAGAGGFLNYGLTQFSFDTQTGIMFGLKAFVAAVLGGIGNLGGAMLGGLLLGVIEALGAGYVGDLTNLCQLTSISTTIAERCQSDPNLTLFGSNYQDVFAFFVLIAVLVFRPSGLLGERVSDRA